MLPLAERLAALKHSVIPVWVYDHGLLRFQWANDQAAELWRASSVAELLARDFSDSSAATRTRLEHYLVRLQRGETVAEDWTLYPRGQPVTMTLHGSGVELDDGRLAILFQALLKETRLDPSLVRGVEALRHASLMVAVIGEGGAPLFLNPAALRAFGDAPPAAAWFGEGADGVLDSVRGGATFRGERRLFTAAGERWHDVEARLVTDPTTGERAILIQESDITARRQAEDAAAAHERRVDEVQQALALVERQRQQILSLSAPILEVEAGIVAVPLIGELDRDRLDELGRRILPAIQERGARAVILDLTGCAAIGEAGAHSLALLLRALALLGTRVLLTGVQAHLAQAMLRSGIALGEVRTMRLLRDGIAHFRGPR